MPNNNSKYGQVEDWASKSFAFLGNLNVVGIQGFEWSQSVNKELIYGSGAEPIAIGRGQKEYSGSMTLLIEEINKLALIAEDGDITNLPPFDIVIVAERAGRTSTRVITAEIMGESHSYSQGDNQTAVEVELMITKVETRNITV